MSYSSYKARVPSHWGKNTWDALFLLASDYPHEKDCDDDDLYPKSAIEVRRSAWKHLIKALPGVLTCGNCAVHFADYIERDGGKALDAALQDREALFRWLYKCKNEVNKRRGKRSPPFEHVKRKYIPKCSRRR